MNQSELIKRVAEKAVCSQQMTGEVLAALSETLQTQLKAGDTVTTPLGIFGVKDRPAKKGRNPRTGEAIDIAASRAVSFKPAKRIRDGINA
ncbi:MAG TPA: HU family DNA-binding protein [Stellaceae bacterium]|nr:HU family DNA-binding protein [Stellaceae bacterium]